MHNPKSPLAVVHREYDGNNIVMYVVQNVLTGQMAQYTPDVLKTLMRNDQIQLCNLKLTTDNRLILVDVTGVEQSMPAVDSQNIDTSPKEEKLEKKLVLLLKMMALKLHDIKLIKLNKEQNTFVYDFSNGKKGQSMKILMKYNLYFDYRSEPKAEIMPVIMHYNGQAYPIYKIPNCDKRIIIDMSKQLTDNTFAQMLENLAVVLVEICKQDPALQSISDDKLMYLIEKMNTDDYDWVTGYTENSIDLKDIGGGLISSAITYGAVFGLTVAAEEPALAALITATSGSFINLMVQHIRLSLRAD